MPAEAVASPQNDVQRPIHSSAIQKGAEAFLVLIESEKARAVAQYRTQIVELNSHCAMMANALSSKSGAATCSEAGCEASKNELRQAIEALRKEADAKQNSVTEEKNALQQYHSLLKSDFGILGVQECQLQLHADWDRLGIRNLDSIKARFAVLSKAIDDLKRALDEEHIARNVAEEQIHQLNREIESMRTRAPTGNPDHPRQSNDAGISPEHQNNPNHEISEGAGATPTLATNHHTNSLAKVTAGGPLTSPPPASGSASHGIISVDTYRVSSDDDLPLSVQLGLQAPTRSPLKGTQRKPSQNDIPPKTRPRSKPQKSPNMNTGSPTTPNPIQAEKTNRRRLKMTARKSMPTPRRGIFSSPIRKTAAPGPNSRHMGGNKKGAARAYSASPERWQGPTSLPESDIVIIPSDSSESNAEEDELPLIAARKKTTPRKRKLDEYADTSGATPSKPRPRPRPAYIQADAMPVGTRSINT